MKTELTNLSMLTRLMWWLAGSQSKLLKDYSAEHLKHTAIGLTIALNGGLASFSSGFALHSVFSSGMIILPALFWGILIFNLDRYIVMTMGQTGLKRWVMSALRIGMTLVLSTVITVPLLLKFFEKEIAGQLASDNQSKFVKAQDALDVSFSEIKKLEEENKILLGEIQTKEPGFNKAYEDFTQEANGTGGTGLAGKGRVYKEKKEHYEKVKADLDELRVRNNAFIDANKARINLLLTQKQDRLSGFTQVNDNANGFLSQYIALDKLRQQNQGADKFYYLLVISFCLLETLPITSKILSSEGAYEHAMKKEEELRKHLIDEKFEKNKEIEKKRLDSQHATMIEIIDLKSRLAEEIIAGTVDTARNDFHGFKTDGMRDDLVGRVQSTIEKEFSDTLP